MKLPSKIAGIRIPDSKLSSRALELAREVSPPLLFNHVVRSYVFGQLLGGDHKADEETIFIAAVLHDLGLTEHARGPRRFEIEGADAAMRFLSEQPGSRVDNWLVWDTIALHPWGDINLFKEPEARVVQLGIMADAVGVGLERLSSQIRAEVIAAFPRLGFKHGFVELLRREAEDKPETHIVHPVHMIAHHCCYPIPMPDARAMIEAAPFPD